jgi:hypothetical protein
MTTDYDICVVTLRHKAIVSPRSVVGMLWLQLHFEDKEWEKLSQGSFLLERVNAAVMVEDAQEAELIVLFE